MATCLTCLSDKAKIKVSRVVNLDASSYILRLLECPQCKRWYRQYIQQVPEHPPGIKGKEPMVIADKKK